MGQQSPPSAPNYAKLYKQGLQTWMQFLQKGIPEELKYRATVNPQELALQQGWQQQFGPTQYRQQLQALQQLDPSGYAAREAEGQATIGNLARGTTLDPTTLQQISNTIQARQAAGGNIYGNAPAMAQAVYQGQRAQQLYSQRLAQAGTFASTLPSYIATTQGIAGVNPNTSFEYINPQAGPGAAQFGLQNYQNQLGAYQLGQQNPWASALGTVGGGIIGGYWGGSPQSAYTGAQIGGAAGNYLGGLFG